MVNVLQYKAILGLLKLLSAQKLAIEINYSNASDNDPLSYP